MSFGTRGNSNGVHLHLFELSAFYHRLTADLGG